MTTFNINYSPVVLVGLFCGLLCLWVLTGRDKFRGPRIEEEKWEREMMSDGLKIT